MALFNIRIDDASGTNRALKIERLLLGEARRLKRDFGMDNMNRLNFFDPDQFTGLASAAYKRERPEVNEKEAVEWAEGLDFISLRAVPATRPEAEAQIADAEEKLEAMRAELADLPEADPTPAATGAGLPPVSDVTPGTPGTTPAASGDLT